MKVLKIEVNYQRKNSMPNYGSLQYGASVTIELGEGENTNDAYNLAWQMVMSQVLQQMNRRIHTQELEKELQGVINAEQK